MACLSDLKKNERLWGIYTGEEEYDPMFRDRYNRFAYYMSTGHNVFKPEVSEFLFNEGHNIEYPFGKRFALALTHDIDNVMLSRLGTISRSVHQLAGGKFGQSAKTILGRSAKRFNPLWNFDKIIALEKKYGAKSSFYFLSLERGDADFSFEIKDLKDELRGIIQSGHEVGLHGGHNAYNNLDILLKQKDRIEKAAGMEVVGYRNHYLRFKIPSTWELLKRAGFKYDATFGYNDCVGFRNGMGHPFRPFNLESGDFIDIIEIPLIIMDCTLDSYMRLDTEQSWLVIKRLLDTVSNISGAVSILWHNTDMQGEKLELYEKILSYGKEKDAWMTSGSELYNWWREHNPIECGEAGESICN